ncbi:MAG TPA: ferrous iron transport protein B [Methylomusa anaerophila]|uniref:Ferrous iron transport protein B n=1 Tax=Methylomusa anaerophila TaxID=1930071 RepID=A0A348AEH0_9FIRM|nr:ferrous iron transport protein B [Methylomusa anaerophila]BBB89468.1 ferrous iron transport protein B [Methylomusa anaerophila]HML89700.1 ferrous iron transport protein B [Methylomusa anaerophila]
MGNGKIAVALTGNPNSGKTTLFNSITGAKQHVGNYPGVTVEKREGFRRYQNKDLLLVDLPGTYSLTAHALDELIARNFIIQDKPDVVVDILDASNLERNLYLAVQLLELERPMVLALNMVDVAKNMGTKIDLNALAEKLGVPVVGTVGNRRTGVDELLTAVVNESGNKVREPLRIDYGADLEEKIASLEELLTKVRYDLRFPGRWVALKLLENDQEIIKLIAGLPEGAAVVAAATDARQILQEALNMEPELAIANYRYEYVGRLSREVIIAKRESVLTVSDNIDQVLTHRLLGLPIFLGLMWLMFNLVFTLGAFPQGWIENGMGILGNFASSYLPDGDLKSLIVDGIIGGVGGVIVFLPQVLILFFGISLLEDTGYMARAAFIMDRIMHAVGLHGKSFIPLLLGFGCSLPAIMGTRTLENPKDRLVTILVTPLMSCSARLPVYTILIGAFFHEAVAGTVLFSIYLIGIVLAIVMARIFRSVLLAGEREPFVMELPQYRLPTLQTIVIHMCERSMIYLRKAGTIILAVSILVWFLINYPSDVSYSQNYEALSAQAQTAYSQQVEKEISQPLHIAAVEDNTELKAMITDLTDVDKEFAEQSEGLAAGSEDLNALEADKEAKMKEIEGANPALYVFASRYVELKNQFDEQNDTLAKEQAGEKLAQSYAGQLGHFIEPAIEPLGFDWRSGIGLIAAFTAKEVLVSTLGTIYNVGEVDETSTDLQQALAADGSFTPLSAYALMVFVLIYSPCLATIAIIKRETNSWKWPLFSSVYSTALAWLMTFGVYQIGRLLGY